MLGNRCAVCYVHSEQSLCFGCQRLISPPQHPCLVCAKSLHQADEICGECRRDPPPFTQTICATVYEPPISLWVQQLKFGGRLDRSRIMAECLTVNLQKIPQTVPIVPVPLHEKRLKKRGFNQALEIARMICKWQNRELLDEVLIRTKNTAMQAELHQKQRAGNVRAAFKSTKIIEHKAVILLDDVMTTGQTMRSCAQVIKQAGASQVIAAVFARSKGV